MRVYVAGLYSRNEKGEVAHIVEALENMRVGIKACKDLLLAGHEPFCPWLDYLFFLVLDDREKITEEQIKRYSLAWLQASEVMVVLPGWQNSPGTKREISEAKKYGITVYHGIEAFLSGHDKGANKKE